MSVDYENQAKPLALRALRTRLGWTQEQMARVLMYTRESYCKVEGAHRVLEHAAPRHEMRLYIISSLHDVVDAGEGNFIPNPLIDIEEAWRTILSMAHEIREGDTDA